MVVFNLDSKTISLGADLTSVVSSNTLFFYRAFLDMQRDYLQPKYWHFPLQNPRVNEDFEA